MTIPTSTRSRAFNLWRAFWPLVVVLAGGLTCDSPTSIGRSRASLAIEPVFQVSGLSSFAGLTIDHVRITVVRPPADTIAQETFAFSPASDSLRAGVSVDLIGSSEQLTAIVEMLAGTQVLFTGSQTVTVTAGPPTGGTPPQVPLAFVGPGAGIASINIAPRDSGITPGAQVQFRAAPLDSQSAAVAQYYLSWSTSDPAHDIDANGLLRAGSATGTIWVYARTPSGIRDSTQLVISATPPSGTRDIIVTTPGGAAIAQGRTENLGVLLRPAATGATTVTVVSDSTQFVTVGGGGTIVIAAGDSTGSITISGHASNIGIARLRTSAPGYPTDTSFVAVIPAIIQMPSQANIAVGATGQLAVSLLPGAPPGGVTLTATSSDTTVARVTTGSVNVAAGVTSANIAVQGVATGTVAILVSAPGYLQGGTALTVGSAAPSPATIQKIQGDNQTAIINDTTAVRPQVRVLDAGGAPVPGIAVLFAVTGGGGSIVGSVSAVTDAAGLAQLGGTWRMGSAAGTNTLSASLSAHPAVTAAVFTATAQPPPPVIQLSVFGSNVVGQARTGTLNVRLLQAAPAGGVTVTLTTTRPGLLRIGTYTSENGSVLVAAGDTLQTVNVFGDSAITGIDTVIATAPGYQPDTLAVPVSQNLISLPTTLNVPISQVASLPVNLSVPAPAGGVQIAVVSSDPSIVQVLTPTITVPAGSQVASANVQGITIGSATLSATNPNFAPDASTASVTAALNITQSSVTLNQSFGQALTVRLESGGTPIAAPAGGIPFSLGAIDPTCAAVPTSATIPAGLQSVNVMVTYGGSATTPCTTRVGVTGPAGFTNDSATITVQPQPGITINATNIGSGLQRQINLNLGASNHGGTTVTLTSTDPSTFLLAPDDTTPGTASIQVPVLINNTFASFYVQGVEGIIADTALINATATGFAAGSAQVRVWQAVIDIASLTGSGNTLQANDAFFAVVGTPNSPAGTFLNTQDAIRAGGSPLTVSFVNDSAAFADLHTTALTADSVTAVISIGQSVTPTSLATGGVEFDFVAAGVAEVRAHAPGFRPVSNAAGQQVTISAPAISVSTNVNVGSGLQRTLSISIPVAAPAGGLPVTLIKNKPGVLLLSASPSTVGVTDTLVVTIPAGQTSVIWTAQALDGIIADTVLVEASSPGFRPDTSAVRVWQAVLDIQSLTTIGNTQQADDPFTAQIGTPSTPTGTFVNTADPRRAGAPPLVVSFVNDSTAYADLVTTAATGDSVTATIAEQQSSTPNSVAAGGVALDFIAAGVARIRAHAPGVRPVAQAVFQDVNVTAPAITVTTTTNVGSGLQRAISVNIPVAAGAGGVPVTLTPSKPAQVLLSDNVGQAGLPGNLTVTIPQGQFSVPVYVQALEGIIADTLLIVATSPGYTPDTATVRIWQAVYDLSGLSTNVTTLAADDAFSFFVGTPSSPTGGFVNTVDVLRAGGPGATASITARPTSAAQLVTSTRTSDSVSVSIPAGANSSPTTVASGGVALDPLSTGFTIVRTIVPGMRAVGGGVAESVTVAAPSMSVNAPGTVGAGLQASGSVSLSDDQHGGIDVTLRTSNPGIAIVAPGFSATVLGDSVIVVHLNNGQSSFSFTVQGLEGQTGSVTIQATAPGFTDGFGTSTIVQPAIEVFGLVSTNTASAADDVFQVAVGVPAPSAQFMQLNQAVRAGGPGLTVTLTSTVPGAGQLVTTAQPGAASVTVQIAPTQTSSPTTVANGGVAFDFLSAGTTFVVPSATGFIAIQQSVPPNPGFRVIVTP